MATFPSPTTRRDPVGVIGALAAMTGLTVLAGVLVTILVTPVIAVAGTTASFGVQAFNTIPEALEIGEQAQTSTIYATRDGQPVKVAEFFSQNREEVGPDAIAQSVKDAVVATEDPRFYEHNGVDSFAAVRAVFQNLSGGDIESGASTVTMQYVRNVLVQQAEAQLESGDPEVVAAGEVAYREATTTTLERKLREIKMAIGVEERFDKEQILTAYLNIANFGGTVYGIESAARYYYGVPAADVTPEQAASLVAMVNSPQSLRIDVPENVPANTERRDLLLANMRDAGMLTAEQAEAAIGTPVTPVITPSTSGCGNAEPASAAYFCEYVRSEVLNSEEFGETREERGQLLRRGGLEIVTTLDLGLQDVAAGELQRQVPATAAFTDIGGSVVSVETGTGRIVAMAQNTAYGSADAGPGATQVNYSADTAHGGSAGFQVGSTYKAFTLVEWLQQGNSLYETVNASRGAWPMSSFTACDARLSGPTYNVRNDTGGAGSDLTPLQATRASVNTGFIAMAAQLDLCDVAETAADLGVTTASGDDLSALPSDVLGSGGNTIAPLQMASAFAAIANDGQACRPVAIDSVTRPDGSAIAPPGADCRQAVQQEAARGATLALESVMAAGGTGTASNPGDGVDILGKTGTTDNSKDTWMVGSTTEVATAVWVGNVQGEVSMRGNRLTEGSADTARHRVFQPVMQAANAQYGGGGFTAPRGSAVTRPAPPAPAPSATPAPAPGTEDGGADRPGQTPPGQPGQTQPGQTQPGQTQPGQPAPPAENERREDD
ncbi:membrane peptidoglycan carboxypeptidase [Frigoribacterium sp. PhB24]|nr:membrane peptidoglycan carboxypeptidase [Frigoribacterium sp. PhB24]